MKLILRGEHVLRMQKELAMMKFILENPMEAHK